MKKNIIITILAVVSVFMIAMTIDVCNQHKQAYDSGYIDGCDYTMTRIIEINDSLNAN